MKKKVLITTIPIENIALTARVEKRGIKLNTPEECFAAANNIEYINGFSITNYATRFIKENVPSVDILEYPTWDEYKEALTRKYDVVGISFWTYTANEAREMAILARQHGVEEVWAGGHGVSTPGIKKYFDRSFTGYSEYQLKPLIEGEDLTNIRHPVLSSKYDFFLKEIKTGYLFSIRGCRYNCSFCSGPRYYERLDITPLDEIERLLDIYMEQGIKHITVVDETFLQNKEHAKKVIQFLHKRNLTWTCTSRVDTLLGNIGELKQFGLQNVYIGIESMNDVSLKNARKGEHASQTAALLKELESYGSFAFGTYMICFENETADSIKENVEKLNMFKSLYGVVFWIVTPFPETDDYEQLDKKGLIIDKDWSHYDALHLVKWHPTITPKEARELLKYCVKNHCHESNVRKKKILRAWDKCEKNEAVHHV